MPILITLATLAVLFAWSIVRLGDQPTPTPTRRAYQSHVFNK